MHNSAKGFDFGTNAQCIRFVRYAKRSCTEIKNEIYVALDEGYISPNQFKPARHPGMYTSRPDEQMTKSLRIINDVINNNYA